MQGDDDRDLVLLVDLRQRIHHPACRFRIERCDGLIGKQDFAGATRAFRAFLDQHPSGDLTDNAWFWLGMAEFFQGAYDEAAKAFLTTVTEYPKGNKAPEALYRLGVSLNKLGQTQDACGALGEVARRYPEADKRILEQTQRAAADIGCS